MNALNPSPLKVPTGMKQELTGRRCGHIRERYGGCQRLKSCMGEGGEQQRGWGSATRNPSVRVQSSGRAGPGRSGTGFGAGVQGVHAGSRVQGSGGACRVQGPEFRGCMQVRVQGPGPGAGDRGVHEGSRA